MYLSYAKSTWWIDSGITIHVASFLHVAEPSKLYGSYTPVIIPKTSDGY
jgi:hypothetical protein